jgi:hypothetical protein
MSNLALAPAGACNGSDSMMSMPRPDGVRQEADDRRNVCDTLTIDQGRDRSPIREPLRSRLLSPTPLSRTRSSITIASRSMSVRRTKDSEPGSGGTSPISAPML